MKAFVISLMIALAGIFVGGAMAHAQAAELRLTCSSLGGGYNECDAGVTVTAAHIVNLISGPCTYGSTWGTHDSRIWVDKGCAADFGFVAGQTPAPRPTPPPPPQPVPQPTTIECRANGATFYPFSFVQNREIGHLNGGFYSRSECEAAVLLAQRENKGVLCAWNDAGFAPFSIATNQVVGNPYIAFQSSNDCGSLIRSATNDLLCNLSNTSGNSWVPYEINSSVPACFDERVGFPNADQCIYQIRASRNQLVCTWNGRNWQPYHYGTHHTVGLDGYGFINLQDCTYDVQLSHDHVVCNWTGNGFQPYDGETNAPLSPYAFSNLQGCYATH